MRSLTDPAVSDAVVPFVVASGGALSTAATARKIAEFGAGFTGWSSAVSPTSNGATVTFIQQTPAATAGTFTLTSTGTAAGTFATVQAGAANDDETGFVAQSAWNIDRMDGSNTAANPSGVLLDPTKAQTYEVIYTHGAIRWKVMAPDGQMVTVHRTLYPNAALTPNQRNPTYRVGWAAASLGSSTALTVKGGEAAAFIEGPREFERDPFSSSVYSFAATTTETVALALRSRAEFGGTNNQREVVPLTLEAGTDTAARTVLARLVVNPTYSTTPDWSYASQTESSVEVATPSGVTITGGREVINMIFSSGSAARLDLRPLDLRLEPGDTLAICLRALSNTATCIVATTRQEV